MSKIGPYLKSIVGVLMSGLTAATPYYGSQHWFEIVTAGLTAVMVYLVPNTKGSLKVSDNSAYGTPYNPTAAPVQASAPQEVTPAPEPAPSVIPPAIAAENVVEAQVAEAAVTPVTYKMSDAAFFNAEMLDGFDVCAVYIGGESAYHVWTDAEVAATGDKPKLPIYVPAPNSTAAEARYTDIYRIVDKIIHYDIPAGQVFAFDLETSKADFSYMQEMAQCLQNLGFGTLVYASKSVIGGAAPAYLWKWDADWTETPHLNSGSMATQWTNEVAGKPFDQSEISADLMERIHWTHG